MGILNTILAAIMYCLKWASNRNDPAAVKDRKIEAQRQDVQSIAGEVQRKDVDKVNQRISDLRKAGLAFVVLGALVSVGCMHARVVYVDDGDKAIPMLNNGRSGWWLPDKVMADLLERATENTNATKAKGN